MEEILVLGSGLVGSVIAADLSNNFSVTIADKDRFRIEKLTGKYNIKGIEVDLNDEDLINTLDKYDIIVNAVPGFMGYRTLSRIIGAGKNTVDISFFAENPFDLNDLAEKNNVTAIVDCGIAPGLSNIILGHHTSKADVKRFDCYVGGLPVERVYPFQYKAPFSPADVIEEYTRPARIKENGVLKIKPALSDPELLEFENIGTLEAFNSDGLRSLLTTMDIPDMREKTLRYPGHLDAVKLLRDSGFLSDKAVQLDGIKIKPVDLTSHLLFDLWKLNEEDDEFTVLLVKIETGNEQETYFLHDFKDKSTGFSSMGRTTGFTCAAAVNLLAAGKINHPGICPPEYIGMDEENFNFILNYLKERNIILRGRKRDSKR